MFVFCLCFYSGGVYLLLPIGAPQVPNQVLQVRVDRYNCPNISGVIRVDGIDDVTPLSYELTVSSSDGCAMQPCPMLLTPEQRAGLNFTLLAGVNYTVMLVVSNDCGFDYVTVHIQPPSKDSHVYVMLCTVEFLIICTPY